MFFFYFLCVCATTEQNTYKLTGVCGACWIGSIQFELRLFFFNLDLAIFASSMKLKTKIATKLLKNNELRLQQFDVIFCGLHIDTTLYNGWLDAIV